MKIKIITLRIQLYGIPFSCAYLAYVSDSDDSAQSIIPIGRRVVVSDGHRTLTVYTDISPIVTQYLKVRVMDDKKFRTFLTDLFNAYKQQQQNLGVNYDKSGGVQIQYVMQNPLIDPNNSNHLLVHGQTPQQQNIRPILDVLDQLEGYSPRGTNMMTFYLNSATDPQNIFYVSQYSAEMSYQYDGKYFYFMNESVGKFKYDLLTGNISFELNENFKQKMAADFKLNYPGTADSDILFNTVSLMPDTRFAMIKYVEQPIHRY